MTAGLRALLNGFLDYAGLFPPAGLDMSGAVRSFVLHRSHQHSWMLSRFVCPASRLGELAAEARGRTGGTPWRISVLAGAGDSPEPVLAALDRDLDAVARFRETLGKAVMADTLEMRLPAPLQAGGDPALLHGFLDAVDARLQVDPQAPGTLYYEIAPAPPDRLRPLAAAVAEQGRKPGARRHGLKLRTGGLEPDAFPSPAAVAGFILAAREAAVPWKATAGLHHPLRRHAPEVGTRMHGFLNVFTAGVLARSRKLDSETVVRILEDEHRGSFLFHPEGLEWQGIGASLREIETARRAFVISEGSCSYMEPVQDLEALGLL